MTPDVWIALYCIGLVVALLLVALNKQYRWVAEEEEQRDAETRILVLFGVLCYPIVVVGAAVTALIIGILLAVEWLTRLPTPKVSK